MQHEAAEDGSWFVIVRTEDQRERGTRASKTQESSSPNKPSLSPSTTTKQMQIPQELIDIMIDMVSVFEDAGDRDSTLRSCALVSHAFAWPAQRKLFSTAQLYEISDHDNFAALLSSSPHIGALVRTFGAEYSAAPYTSHPIAITKILAALPYLECICSDSGDSDQIFNVSSMFFDACRRACSLPTVRRIELNNHTFADAMELESLLDSSTGLRELSLESISFESLRVVPVPSSRSITLESLEFSDMDEAILQCILDAFTTVDVKHLRSLRFERAAVRPILGVNAGSLREVEIEYDDDPLLVGDTFTGQSKLQSIHLNAYYAEDFGRIIASLGQLSDLRRLTMDVRDQGVWPSEEAEWMSIDRALSATRDLRNLEEIHIHVRPTIWGEGVKLEDRFPLLGQSGLLHLFHISFGF
ncbi:hypothetical protein DFH06DRAFT_3288 [Mycena polygramma]|nr:hypothetical protein DFH06DRAFT_3288 [Mycena polygramma]